MERNFKMSKSRGTGSIDRSARVHRIKRVIIGLAVTVVLLPSVLCILLFAKLSRLERQITELSYQKEIVNVVTESTTVTKANKSEPVSDSNNNITVVELTDDSSKETESEAEEIDESPLAETTDEAMDTQDADENSTEENASEVSEEVIEESPADSQVKLKKVYLTFDDGPSSNTGRILDILNSYGVKGTFFVVGRLSDTTTPMYKRIVNEGHTIAMHSYTHKYDEIYASKEAFIYDLDRIQSLIYEQTGVLSKIYRFPGGSSNHVSRTDVSVLAEELGKRDIVYYDWNVVSGDASSRFGLPKDQIVRNCTQGAMGYEEAMILIHDLPEKATSVEALPEIIEYFQNLGVEIAAIDENTTEVHHDF